ncbi:hypothetical protein NJ7G_4359 [Natrinema sp. J7-2]|nr:hypothetical protein NJ7G_4359 [Natrinema sp. J7-2]
MRRVKSQGTLLVVLPVSGFGESETGVIATVERLPVTVPFAMNSMSMPSRY